MSKTLLKSLLVCPAALSAALVLSTSAFAVETSTQAADLINPSESTAGSVEAAAVTPVEAKSPIKIAQAAPEESSAGSLNQISQYGSEGATSSGQVTSVSQLSDVQPTDWAFQALQSLVERYGCIVGYPDSTYRGNRAMTRYEFAAGLNACMDRVNELIASATADLVRKEDLVALQKLQEEFAAELATLRGRVDALEARTTQLEAQQFSTTTKLAGEVIFAVSAAENLDENRAFDNGLGAGDNEAVFQNRVRLTLNTSFTGKDLLVTRLASANAPLFNIQNSLLGNNSAEGRQTFQLDTGNDVVVDWLAYYFPVGKKAQVYVAAVGGLHSDYLVSTANPYLEDFGGGSGALSFLGQDNPIYNIGGGSGAGFTYKFNDTFGVNVGYLAGGRDTAASPLEGQGLFNGSYAGLFQFTAQPLKGKLKIAATYINSYHTDGTPIFSYGTNSAVVGTDFANFPFARGFGRVNANSGGLSASYQVHPKVVVSAWGSYTTAELKNGNRPDADIWSYGLRLAFPDAFKKGNLGGIIVGASPYLGNSREVTGLRGFDSTPIHIEGFYKFQLNNYISVTPGIIYLLNPNQTDNGSDTIIGTVRTTFKF